MHYINTQTGEYPIEPAQIIAAHPLTLFPVPFEPCEGYSLVQPGTPPAHNADTHKAVELQPEQVDGVWRQAWDVVLLTAHEVEAAVQALREQLTATATARRWAVETGGILLPSGVRVATGLEDQNRITRVIANAQFAGVATVDFKAASGWVSLTLPELQSIAAAIALHVQACFAAERAHHEAIDALQTLAAARAYDTGQSWPA